MKDVFSRLYGELNDRQKEAVGAIEGPVMVLAGPGTGKTRVLTLRIANILREADVEPENILALTFTEAAAREMRERLRRIIGGPAFRCTITTFHGFCNDVILSHPDEFPEIVGAVPTLQVEAFMAVQDILRKGEFSILLPPGNPRYYVKSALGAVAELKRDGWTPDAFASWAEDKGGRTRELARLYRAYEERLRADLRYDYEDMLLFCLGALEKNEELLRSLQERYLYLTADEHQDANETQNRVLELVASFHKSPNIFVVGDEKQAIFRFQGASAANFRRFRERYGASRVIRLTENYRSPKEVLGAASRLLADEHLVSRKRGGSLRVREFEGPDEELYALASEIRELLDRGVAPDDIAVLHRDNKDAPAITWMLQKFGVPLSVESDVDVLADEDIANLLVLLSAVDTMGDELVARSFLLPLWNIPPAELHAELADLKNAKSKKVRGVMDRFFSWHAAAKTTNATEAFERICRESGFLSFLLSKENSVAQIGKLQAVFEELRRVAEWRGDARLADALLHFEAVKEHGIGLARSLPPALGTVRVMTAHKAKGREFLHVFLVNVQDKKWGSRSVPRLFELPTGAVRNEQQDERRLLYVALTRARETVTLSYSLSSLEGTELLPSLFLQEISRERSRGSVDAKELADKLFVPPVVSGPDYKTKTFVREKVREQGLSVTALNNYLSCPWKWYFLNLVRMPKAPEPHQAYGTAVHAALKDFFEAERKTKKLLLDRFDVHVSSKNLERPWKARGREALAGWYGAWRGNWPKNVVCELRVRGVFLGSLPLTGVIDKLELGEEVNVVDYKTGRPRSRNDIEGRTKNSAGDLKRQLVFYKLLLDRYRNGRYHMTTAELDFVEPNPRGRYKKERFVVTKEETDELASLVEQVADEMANLKFFKRTCQDKRCEFCAMRIRT